MRRLEVKGGDAATLRAERKGTGAEVREEAGGIFVEYGDDADGLSIGVAVRRHLRTQLLRRLRQAKTVAEVRDAVADALEALL